MAWYYEFIQNLILTFFKFCYRYHSAAAMRSAYNTGSVSGTGGVSDCAGLQSIGAAITSAATGDYVFKFINLMKLNDIQIRKGPK